jgi:hypothetical protein
MRAAPSDVFGTLPDMYVFGASIRDRSTGLCARPPRAPAVAASEIAVVSCNGWDAIGATWFGYATSWVNRTGSPLERLGATLYATGRTLTAAADFLISRLR